MKPVALSRLFLVANLALVSCSEQPRTTLREVNLSFVREVGREVFNYPGTPVLGSNALALGDRRLYVYDSQGTVPFYALDLESFELRGFGAWGAGRARYKGDFL